MNLELLALLQKYIYNINFKTDCKLLTLDRMSFKRLLGPIENLLKRNSDKYEKYIKESD